MNGISQKRNLKEEYFENKIQIYPDHKDATLPGNVNILAQISQETTLARRRMREQTVSCSMWSKINNIKKIQEKGLVEIEEERDRD